MSRLWYYRHDEKQIGPILEGALRRLARKGELLPTDLVWTEGMQGWEPASKFTRLFPKPSPASPPASVPQPPPIVEDLSSFDFAEATDDAQSSTVGTDYGQRHNNRSESIGIGGFVLVYLSVVATAVLLLLGWVVIDSNAPKDQRKSLTWETVLIFEIVFALAAGAAICVLPIVAGRVWKDDSEVLTLTSGQKIQVLIPKSMLGWVGYYVATWVVAGCCIVMVLAVFGMIIMSNTSTGSRVCRHCGAIIRENARFCPRCFYWD